MLQHVAVWCSLAQLGAVLCRVLMCGAVCCSVLQCVVVWCSVVQCGGNMLQCVTTPYRQSEVRRNKSAHQGREVRCSACCSVCCSVCCSKCCSVSYTHCNTLRRNECAHQGREHIVYNILQLSTNHCNLVRCDFSVYCDVYCSV